GGWGCCAASGVSVLKRPLAGSVRATAKGTLVVDEGAWLKPIVGSRFRSLSQRIGRSPRLKILSGGGQFLPSRVFQPGRVRRTILKWPIIPTASRKIARVKSGLGGENPPTTASIYDSGKRGVKHENREIPRKATRPGKTGGRSGSFKVEGRV